MCSSFRRRTYESLVAPRAGPFPQGKAIPRSSQWDLDFRPAILKDRALVSNAYPLQAFNLAALMPQRAGFVYGKILEPLGGLSFCHDQASDCWSEACVGVASPRRRF